MAAPSSASSATSVAGPCPVPTFSPTYSIGMASSGPSPMITVPSIAIASNAFRIASIAATSAAVSLPRPMKRADASAAASVTRTSSMARFRSMGRGSAAQQPLEQRVRLLDEDALLAGVALVVAATERARLLLVACDVDDEGDRVVGVRLDRAGRRVVGHDEDAPVPARLPETLEHRADDLLVEVLDRLDLLLRVAEVAALVRRLDVEHQELALLERPEAVLGLAE